MERREVEAALDAVRPALSEDGLQLSVLAVHADGRVDVALTAASKACFDCLMPDDVLVSVLEASIKSTHPHLGPIRLTKDGAFEQDGSGTGQGG